MGEEERAGLLSKHDLKRRVNMTRGLSDSKDAMAGQSKMGGGGGGSDGVAGVAGEGQALDQD